MTRHATSISITTSISASISTVAALALLAPFVGCRMTGSGSEGTGSGGAGTEGAVVARPAGSLDERLAAAGVRRGDPAFLRVFKESSELEVWLRRDGSWRRLPVYPICAWSGTLGPKLAEGDRQAPEGFYAVAKGALNPHSKYHLSFNLGYPNAYDRAHGRTGSWLMIHGDCVSIGCYAMTDPAIEEIYGLVEAALDAGQPSVPVHAFPFRMTDGRLRRAAEEGSRWLPFWENLAEGHARFERDGAPPEVGVRDGRYVFAPEGS